MRLDKFLAVTTGLSRAQAKRELHHDQVRVNQAFERDTGRIVSQQDQIEWRDQLLSWPGPRYLMLHKPPGYECSHQPVAHPSVFSLIDLPRVDQLQVVGRLDQDTTGLLLLTDDGQWLHQLTSPKKKQGKTYLVSCAQPITEQQLAALRQGVLLHGEDQPTLPAQAHLLAADRLELCIHEGRYHQVKRMLAAVGNRVVALHRSAVSHLQLDAELGEGQWRWLTQAEVELKKTTPKGG